MMINAYLQENHVLETLLINKANELDHNLIVECFSNFMEVCTFKNNEIIYRQDDYSDKFFIIIKGQVVVLVPVKNKVSITRYEFFKILENLLYEGDIGLVKLILNSNYEKISFENYTDFKEFAQAKAKLYLVDKIDLIFNEKVLENFYLENIKIFNTFEIFKSNELNFFFDKKDVYEEISENEFSSRSEKDSSYNDEDEDDSDKNNFLEKSFQNKIINKKENYNISINKEKIIENKKTDIKQVRSPYKNIDQLFINFEDKTTKKIKLQTTNNHQNSQKIDFIDAENFSSQISYKNNSKKISFQLDNLKNNNIEYKKRISKNKLVNLNYQSNDISKLKGFKEVMSKLLKLNPDEEEILKKYPLMDNQIIYLDYNIFSTHPKILKEKEYFGDFGLDSSDKKRTATVKGNEENTILGFITKEIYNEYIYNKNQKIILKNIQVLNNISFFKSISSGNFNKNYYKNFELKRYSKNEFIMDQNGEVNQIYIIKEGKVDVFLYANIFEIQSLMENIQFNLFKNSITTNGDSYFKKLEELNFKKISKNQFKKEQLENLYIRKNVNLFSLQNSEVIGIEPIFLKINSFYKVNTVSEKLTIYGLNIINFNQILTDSPECKQSFDKLAVNKCLVILTRLNDIKNSILNLSNFKFDNNQNSVINNKANKMIKNTLEMQIFNNLKENSLAGKESKNYDKMRIKGFKTFLNDSHKNSDKFNKLISNENSSMFNSNSKDKILNKVDLNSNIKNKSCNENSDVGSAYNNNKKYSFVNPCDKITIGSLCKDYQQSDFNRELENEKHKLELNGFISDRTRNVNDNEINMNNRQTIFDDIQLNILKKETSDVKDLDYKFSLTDRNKKLFKKDFREFNKKNNYLKSNINIRDSNEKINIKKKSDEISDPIKLNNNLIFKEYNNLKDNFSFQNKNISLFQNDALFENQINSPKHFKEFEKQLFLKKKKDNEIYTNEFYSYESISNDKNTHSNFIESYNFKEIKLPNNLNNSKSFKVFGSYNKHQKHLSMKINMSKGFQNINAHEDANFKHKNESLHLPRKNSDFNFFNLDQINNNRISNIYFNESDRIDMQKYRIKMKNIKSEEKIKSDIYSLGNTYIKESIKTQLIGSDKSLNINSNLINKNLNLIKKKFNQKSVIMNRTFMKINLDKRLILDHSSIKNSHFKNFQIDTYDDNKNKYNSIKSDNINLDTFTPKESKINETYKNIHNLRNRIKESSVKKILFKKN